MWGEHPARPQASDLVGLVQIPDVTLDCWCLQGGRGATGVMQLQEGVRPQVWWLWAHGGKVRLGRGPAGRSHGSAKPWGRLCIWLNSRFKEPSRFWTIGQVTVTMASSGKKRIIDGFDVTMDDVPSGDSCNVSKTQNARQCRCGQPASADSGGHLGCGVRARGPQPTVPPELRGGLCQPAPGNKGAGKGPGSLSAEPPSPPRERAALGPGEESAAVGSRRAGAPVRGSRARLRAGRGSCRPSCGLPGTWRSLASEQPRRVVCSHQPSVW